jgi:hypothetical protein
MATKKTAAKKDNKNSYMMNTLFVDDNGKTVSPKKGVLPAVKKKK